MKVTRNHTKEPLQNLRIGSYNFGSVREFTDLGVCINDENKIKEEIKERTVNGNRAYFSHLQLFRSNLLCKRTKVEVYKTLVRS
jgi:hypothetical protein